MAPPKKHADQLQAFCGLSTRLAMLHDADSLLFLLEHPVDCALLRKATGKYNVLLVANDEATLKGAAEEDFDTIVLNTSDRPVYERLTQALLEAVAEEILKPGDCVVSVYSGFETGMIDSLSLIRLDEHLGRLTVRDLNQLKTKIPVETLKLVVDLAVSIGREGREGKRVGTMFVVGDNRKIMKFCRPTGFDPVKGYSRSERNLKDFKVREGIKEIAQMDGAFVISVDGTVTAAAQYISAPAAIDISLSKGLGTRHWSAAAITKETNAVAIAVSETNGTVRIFQHGEVVLRIEPLERAMKWKEFVVEAPTPQN